MKIVKWDDKPWWEEMVVDNCRIIVSNSLETAVYMCWKNVSNLVGTEGEVKIKYKHRELNLKHISYNSTTNN